MAQATPTSAFELLRRSWVLPVAEPLPDERAQLAAAGAAWGRQPRAWRDGSSGAQDAREVDGEDQEDQEDGPVGGAMPRELRALAAASFDVFSRVSQTPLDESAPAAEVLRASREYREALTTCIFALEDALTSPAAARASADEEMKEAQREEDEGSEDEEFVDLLKVSLAIWHLCELLLLQRGAWSDRRVAYELAQWLQEHYASAAMDRLAREHTRLGQTAQPEEDAAFWPTVWSLAMAGRGGQAWRLLATHSSYTSLLSRDVASRTGSSMRASFQQVQRVLERMPGEREAGDGDDDWAGWRAECEHLLSADGYVRAHGELSTLLRILVADEETLASRADSWYELMLARLVLDEPKRVAHRFEFLMAHCFQAAQGRDAQMGPLDCIVLAILQYDVQSALQDVAAMGLSWMAAHLTDLLVRSGVVAGDAMDDSDCSLRERVLLEYALELSATRGMWPLVAGYGEQCPRFGPLVVVGVVGREPVPTDRKAESLLNYCRGKPLLAEAQRAIAVRRATRLQQQKAFGAALVWLLRAHKLREVDAVCDAVLDECRRSSSLAPLHEAVEFLNGSDALVSLPLRLQWLARYREFHLVLEDRRHVGEELAQRSSSGSDSDRDDALERKYRFVSAEAAKRLHVLLRSDMAPRSLRVHLLEEAERLLELSPSVFEPPHLHALLAFLGSIDRSFDRADAFAPSSAGAALQQRVQQLALRNLSEALRSPPRRSSGPSPGSADAFRDGVNSSAFVGGHRWVAAGAALATPMDQ